MTLLERMDRAVYATGIDRLIFMKVAPRRLRWAPLIACIALIAGYVLLARPVQRPFGPLMAGIGLFYGAYLAAHFLRLLGPRLHPSVSPPLDERELMIKARAYALSGLILAISAMAGCFYMAMAGVLGWWQPHTPSEWINLGFGLQALALLLPTLIASWMQPAPPANDQD